MFKRFVRNIFYNACYVVVASYTLFCEHEACGAAADYVAFKPSVENLKETLSYYKEGCQTSPGNQAVWFRVLEGNPEDNAVLFVGYSNRKSRYGDEGSDILKDTPGCSRTVFFSGGSDNAIFTLEPPNVDQNDYNHLYGDFRYLDSQFPYLVNSVFFDLIFIGMDTFLYMIKASILKNFCTMVKNGGQIIIPARKNYNFTCTVTSVIGESFSVVPYFYAKEKKERRCSAFDAVAFIRPLPHGWIENSVDIIREKIKTPFADRFFEQNKDAGVVISITKKL
ncbi:MAG: hypothetical protein LBJ71_00220 [Holosporaceae bacterium]|jgi:hypothetical protein|nr:hypothetical protein [Holosporaceae bacterium]